MWVFKKKTMKSFDLKMLAQIFLKYYLGKTKLTVVQPQPQTGMHHLCSAAMLRCSGSSETGAEVKDPGSSCFGCSEGWGSL